MALLEINQYQAKAFAGMLVGIGNSQEIDTFKNNAGNTNGVYDLTAAAANGHTYTATIYGIPVEFTSDSDGTTAEARDGLLAAIAAVPAFSALITAAASGLNVRITEKDGLNNGKADISDLDGSSSLATVEAHSNEEPMPAGIFVARGANAGDCTLPSSSGDYLAGIVVHGHHPVNEQKYGAGSANLYPPNSLIPVCKKGKVWCKAETACDLSDDVYVRYSASGDNTQLGAVRNDADTSTAVQMTSAAFKSKCEAGELVLVEVDIL